MIFCIVVQGWGKVKHSFFMTRGEGLGVQTHPKTDGIIYEQPLLGRGMSSSWFLHGTNMNCFTKNKIRPRVALGVILNIFWQTIG